MVTVLTLAQAGVASPSPNQALCPLLLSQTWAKAGAAPQGGRCQRPEGREEALGRAEEGWFRFSRSSRGLEA